MKNYAISTTDGRQDIELSQGYSSLAAAKKALKTVMGWSRMFIREIGSGDEWCAYPTMIAADSDVDGSYAPRIIKGSGQE